MYKTSYSNFAVCCQFYVQKSDEHLPIMAELLGIDTEQIRFWLCNRKIVMANETVTKPLTSTQVCRLPQNVGDFLSCKHFCYQ